MQFSQYFGYIFMIAAVTILIGIYLFSVIFKCVKDKVPDTKVA